MMISFLVIFSIFLIFLYVTSCYTTTDDVDMISDWEGSENEDEFGYDDVEDMYNSDYQEDSDSDKKAPSNLPHYLQLRIFH